MLGLRIDKALSLIPAVGSRSRAEHLIAAGAVKVNGSICKPSLKVKATDVFEIAIPEPQGEQLLPYDFPLNIIFEDMDVLVLVKPAGLVVHPAAGHENDTLVNALIGQSKNLSMKFGENRPGIVHRLDKETSGLLVVAKNDKAHENLAAQFKDRSIHRLYHAVCFGVPSPKEGFIESTLARHPTHRQKFASLKSENSEVGKWAKTNYKVLRSSQQLSYVALKLETGRTHQIRVHMSELGCPLVRDDLYGAAKKQSRITNRELKAVLEQVPRVCLHACELGFQHPTTHKKLFFKEPWPDDVGKYLTDLGFGDLF